MLEEVLYSADRWELAAEPGVGPAAGVAAEVGLGELAAEEAPAVAAVAAAEASLAEAAFPDAAVPWEAGQAQVEIPHTSQGSDTLGRSVAGEEGDKSTAEAAEDGTGLAEEEGTDASSAIAMVSSTFRYRPLSFRRL